jgi:hypothetical protein
MTEPTLRVGQQVRAVMIGRLAEIYGPTGKVAFVEVQRPEIGHTVHVSIPLDSPDVTIKRLMPAEWPPRVGDLWRDVSNSLWFAIDVSNPDLTDKPEVKLVSTWEDQRDPEAAHDLYGPLILIRREGQA